MPMKPNMRQCGTDVVVNDFSNRSVAANRLHPWGAPLINLSVAERRHLESSAARRAAFYSSQRRQGDFEENLAFAVLGLSGIAGVISAFAAAL
jgi:hypothetical protein